MLRCLPLSFTNPVSSDKIAATCPCPHSFVRQKHNRCENCRQSLLQTACSELEYPQLRSVGARPFRKPEVAYRDGCWHPGWLHQGHSSLRPATARHRSLRGRNVTRLSLLGQFGEKHCRHLDPSCVAQTLGVTWAQSGFRLHAVTSLHRVRCCM